MKEYPIEEAEELIESLKKSVNFSKKTGSSIYGMELMLLYITNLEQQISQLTNNWNELEEYIEKIIIDSKAGSGQQYYYLQMLKTMKEIQEGNND